jgi:peptidase E
MTTEPTILATSGGWSRGSRYQLTYGPLLFHALELAGSDGRKPKVCHIGTAGGDQQFWLAAEDEAARLAGVEASHLNLFPMPNVDDIEAHLLDQDVIWVNGGSVANLLAVWRVHGLHEIFPRVWQAGVVLGGVSAGSLCWHIGGTTDSYGPELRAVTNGLAMLPYSNGVHYDSEEQRRPLFQKLIADGTLPAGYATDDGVGLLYRGTTFVEALAEHPGKAAYFVEPGPDGGATETALPTRKL